MESTAQSELLSQLQEGEFWVEEDEFLREFDEVTIGFPISEAGHLQSLCSGKGGLRPGGGLVARSGPDDWPLTSGAEQAPRPTAGCLVAPWLLFRAERWLHPHLPWGDRWRGGGPLLVQGAGGGPRPCS